MPYLTPGERIRLSSHRTEVDRREKHASKQRMQRTARTMHEQGIQPQKWFITAGYAGYTRFEIFKIIKMIKAKEWNHEEAGTEPVQRPDLPPRNRQDTRRQGDFFQGKSRP